jgi:bifunctional UDP-N-acetylglucosamine pyrophosphorylase/glucosamine-1-phosphate N-acetyltransferase
MSIRPTTIVVLAAGKGTRMKSALPKVLHPVAGLSMLGHTLALARGFGATRVAVVVGPGMEAVGAEARRHVPTASIHLQAEQRGTADAVAAARPVLGDGAGDVLVLFADTPLLAASSLAGLTGALAAGADAAVLGFEAADPKGYGRLLTAPDGRLEAIREEKDASPGERAVRLCNSGVMAFAAGRLESVLPRIGNANAAGEYYLTDAIALICADGGRAAVVTCPEEETLGVNDRAQLARAEALWQAKRRLAAMRDGVTMTAPETVWLSHDTRLGRDVMLEPNVFIGPGVAIGDGVVVRANSHLEGATIAAGARIGPFARLRPGAAIEQDVHVGNFVEVKAARMEAGSKANHLAYIGDGRVGAGANIGAGTIFCNYDGFNKNFTDVGAGAFVGSNSSLVAPVKIGDGAYVGSGSVITKNVEAGALALERSEQQARPGWAERFRTMMARRKAAAKGG